MTKRTNAVRAVPCASKGLFFGEVTLMMLLEKLKSCTILAAPKSNRMYSWFIPVVGSENLESVLKGEVKERTLFLCHDDSCRALLERDSSCSCVVLVPPKSDVSWVNEAPFDGRVIVVEQNERFYIVSTTIQQLFSETLIWESKMDHFNIRNQNKSQFANLVAMSQEFLGNFVCVTDNAYNFIVSSTDEKYTQHAAPYSQFISHGCFDQEEIAFITEQIVPIAKSATPLVICEPDERHAFTTFHYPIYIDNAYLFHVVMVCEYGSVEYLQDIFAKFINRFVLSCRDYWKTYVDLSAPWHRLFNALIDRKPIEQHYRDVQTKASMLPDFSQIRVLTYHFDDSLTYDFRSRVVDATKLINNGNCLPFMHYGELVVVCYTSQSEEMHLSGRLIMESANEIIYKPFGLVGGMSQRIFDIEDLCYAYDQATNALKYRDAFEEERHIYGDGSPAACIPFDFTLKYYLLDPDRDTSLIKFSFEHNVFCQLIDEDRQKGTNIARMVIALIGNNLNGTKASGASHAHRNTILYHVSRIEKRFDISLKDPFTNQRVMLDYHYWLNRKVIGNK